MNLWTKSKCVLSLTVLLPHLAAKILGSVHWKEMGASFFSPLARGKAIRWNEFEGPLYDREPCDKATNLLTRNEISTIHLPDSAAILSGSREYQQKFGRGYILADKTPLAGIYIISFVLLYNLTFN